MKMSEFRVTASQVRAGDYLPGLDNGYVFEDPEEGNGYLAYPSTGYGQGAAMPQDTLIVGYHDAEGEEQYLLLSPRTRLTIAVPFLEAEDRIAALTNSEDEDDDY